MSNPVDKLSREMASLRKELANIKIRQSRQPQPSTSRGARRRSRSRSRNNNKREFVAPVATSRKSNMGKVTMQGNMGSCQVSGSEVASIVKMTKSTTSVDVKYGINPGHDTSSAQLKAMASIYSLYRFTHWSAEWEPMCGTTTNGAVMLAFAPDVSGLVVDYATVARAQPNITGPLFSQHKIVCPPNYYNEKRWYQVAKEVTPGKDTENPVWLLMDLQSDSSSEDRSLGRLRITYSVVFEGFKLGATPSPGP